MKKKISIMLCIVLFALTGCTNSGSTIRFGAADIGGMYYSFANTFTELANEQGYDFTCKVRTREYPAYRNSHRAPEPDFLYIL